jgi:hypothetical protein
MSIGNLKDTGNQGNNLPFQWKVLQGLQQLLTQVSQPLDCDRDSIKICATDKDGNPAPVRQGNVKCDDSLAVTLCNGQAGVQITPNIQVLSGVIGFLPDAVYSISFANVGTVPIKLSFDGGTTTVTIPVGVTINMDAGGLNNLYPANTFAWDTDFVGASLIITYNTPAP